jgi:Na+/melibiose symporter-like transporter
MSPSRRTALIAGIWFALTFITSIPALLLYDPILNDTNYILGDGADTRIELGALLEIGLAISGIATAVVFYPVLKRQSQSLALGYIGSRTVESVMILVGVLAVLSVVTLRQDVGGPDASDPAALEIAGRSLIAVKDWTFLLGPALCSGLGNGLVLGYLMYASEVVPRRMALLGLIGGPVSAAGAVAVLFGAWDQTDPIQFVLTIGEILWEVSLSIYLIVKGFRATPITAAYDRDVQSAMSP